MTRTCLLSAVVLLLSLEAPAQSNSTPAALPQGQPEAVQKIGSIDAAKPMAAKVFYTGDMFGYFRLPNEQSIKLVRCPDGVTEDLPSAEGKILIKTIGNAEDFAQAKDHIAKAKEYILLGMGNNFSPELYSRYMTDGAGKKLSRDFFTWDYASGQAPQWVLNNDAGSKTTDDMARGNGRIPADNVACFISLAGYTAIVPGKHDFYFGPEYVRYLARLLASPQESGGTTPKDTYRPVQMLGANLVIQTTVDKAAKRIPYQEKLPKPAYSNDSGDLKFVVPPAVLPWARTLLIKNATSATRIYICPAGTGEHQRDPDQTKENCPDRKPLTRVDDAGTYAFPSYDDQGHTFLSPNGDYLLCAENPPNRRDLKDKRPYCQHLSVYSPFFMHPSLIPAPNRKSPNAFDVLDATQKLQYKNPRPYAIVDGIKVDDSHAPTSVAVFGVVDQELNEHIGRLNYAWMNGVSRYSTEVTVIDPVEALKQLLQYFNEAEPDFKGLKVLLAQMPAYKARRIAAAMRGKFNLIVAEADWEEATPDKTETVRIPEGSSPEDVPTFLTVPAPFYDYRDHKNETPLTLQLRSAVVSRDEEYGACGTEHSWKWGLRNIPEQAVPISHPPVRLFADEQFQAFVNKALNAYLPAQGSKANGTAGAQHKRLSEDDAAKQLQDLTLAIMQENKHSDVALLQKRDLFTTAYVDANAAERMLQETLDRVFWKGDFVLNTLVRGDVLKKVMARSKQFDDEDSASLSLSHERERGLVPLGIFADPGNSQFMVNGEALDDNKLYSVATTDYIALGDTGYSDLLKPAVGDPEKPSQNARLEPISVLVCGKIKKANPEQLEDAKCNDTHEIFPINGRDYFNELDQSPFDNTPGFTPARHLLAWARFLKRRSTANPSAIEQSVQQRPVWTVSLSKLALGFTLNQHNNGTEANLASLFAGIAVPQVSAPNTNTTSIDSSLRVQRSSQGLELFEQSDVSYSRQLTRQSDAANSDLEAQLKNQVAFEAGVLPRLRPRFKYLPSLKALISMRFEENLVPPLTAFRLGLTPTVVLRQETPRKRTFLGKYGIRVDNQKSYLETGFEAGEAFSVPVAYTFIPGRTCPATQAKKQESLATCISNNSLTSAGPILASSRALAVTTDRPRDGLFLNFKITMPLPFNDGLAYVMENKGEFFFNRAGDFSVDSKFQDDWANSLNIPLWGNLSFVPKLEWFFYQNKVDNNYFRSLQTSLGLQYKFDWRPGLHWKHALAYRTPQ